MDSLHKSRDLCILCPTLYPPNFSSHSSTLLCAYSFIQRTWAERHQCICVCHEKQNNEQENIQFQLSLVSQTDINQRLIIINAKLHHKRRRTAVWGCLVEDLNCTGASESRCLGNDDSWDVNNNRVSSCKEDRKGRPTREGTVTHRLSGEAPRYTRWSCRAAKG